MAVDNDLRWLFGWRWWLIEFVTAATVFGAVVLNNVPGGTQ